jgi:tRNA threonylcarbamoyladenosine biosynthesis protein TsaB
LRHRDSFRGLGKVELADHGFAFPTASSLVQLAHAQALREQFVQPNEIRPLYLRLPDVDIGWSTRDGRISG